ncbi:Thermolabile hemolysin [Smittium culicis]|uniref:Thermolabile hemolysin n=1 Tax=Smittium culicis TaxID=133412 RepID=A0A1R1XIE3_9FUNG|nr:Thermolabile hemolysin [Smittium culicis]
MSLKSIERIVVFGDSNVDGGNVYMLSGKTFPSPPYFEGKFTNGPTWVESLARVLGVSIDNYAYGGATIDNSLVAGTIDLSGNSGLGGSGRKKRIPGVKQQILKYLKLYPQSSQRVRPERTLFIIQAGMNDISSMLIPKYYSKRAEETSPEIFATRLSECIMIMHEHAHAKNIVVLNQFPHELYPYVIQMSSTEIFQRSRAYSIDFNNYLRKLMRRLAVEYPNLNVIQHDSYQLIKKVISDPTKYGLDDDSIIPAVDWPVKSGYSGVVVGKGSMSKMWFDDSHFGARMHNILAADILQTISLHIMSNPTNFG